MRNRSLLKTTLFTENLRFVLLFVPCTHLKQGAVEFPSKKIETSAGIIVAGSDVTP